MGETTEIEIEIAIATKAVEEDEERIEKATSRACLSISNLQRISKLPFYDLDTLAPK